MTFANKAKALEELQSNWSERDCQLESVYIINWQHSTFVWQSPNWPSSHGVDIECRCRCRCRLLIHVLESTQSFEFGAWQRVTMAKAHLIERSCCSLIMRFLAISKVYRKKYLKTKNNCPCAKRGVKNCRACNLCFFFFFLGWVFVLGFDSVSVSVSVSFLDSIVGGLQCNSPL